MVQDKHAVSIDAARAELSRIPGSPHLDASERDRGFLAVIVEDALAARTKRIKAYTIATKAFGRDSTFDPQLDSVVRIEVGRLRRSLERDYLTGGRTSRLRIDVPHGGYAPVFGGADPVAPPHATPGIHRVEVTDFEEAGDTRGLTRSLTIALTRFTGLRVYCAETALRPPADIDAGAARPELAADCLVTGQTSLRPDGFEVDVILVEAERDRAFWAETFDRRLESSEIIALRSELANRVARALAQPYGAIQSDRERDADGRAPERPGSHTAVLLFYASWRNFERAVESTAAGLGRDDDAVGAIRGLDSEHGAHIFADVRSRDAAPGLARRIIAGVEKAGLTITAPERGAHAP